MKILSIIEATTVTGPAKNLLNFYRLIRSSQFGVNGKPPVEVSIVTFQRAVRGAHKAAVQPPAIPTGRGSDNAFVAAARDMGITVDVITERFRFDTAVLKQLRSIVARRAPDIIQTHMIKSHFLVKLAGLGRNYPWIAYHHGYTTTDLKMRFYNQLNRWSLPSASRVITVCDAFANELSRSGVDRDRMSVCHNSVVPPRKITRDEQRAQKQKLGITDHQRVIITVGRLSREKGHADLIHAVAMLREIEPTLEFKLLIVGDGPEGQQLETLISDLRLIDDVTFLGHVDDVAPYYAIADLVAMPSHSEGSPNVLLEAMAAGIPVVATSVGGVPEIATSEKNALLVPARAPQLFANALHRVLTEQALAQRLSANATTRAAEFSPESYARSLIRIYQDVVTEPRPVGSGATRQPCLNEPVAIAPGSDNSA